MTTLRLVCKCGAHVEMTDEPWRIEEAREEFVRVHAGRQSCRVSEGPEMVRVPIPPDLARKVAGILPATGAEVWTLPDPGFRPACVGPFFGNESDLFPCEVADCPACAPRRVTR